MSPRKSLGVMRPLGGGDPIPLKKEELILGRRPNCDIRLDFENISGKHAVLKYHKGTWHVRDLGSTNGTTINGTRINSEHGVLPDDALGIAGHFFKLDYDAAAPAATANLLLGEEMGEELGGAPKRASLMELAGLEGHDSASKQRSRPQAAPERVVRPSADEGSFDQPIPDKYEDEPAAKTDDDFFNMIKGDVKDEPNRPKKRRP